MPPRHQEPSTGFAWWSSRLDCGCRNRFDWSGDKAETMGQNDAFSWEEFLSLEMLRTEVDSTSLFLTASALARNGPSS